MKCKYCNSQNTFVVKGESSIAVDVIKCFHCHKVYNITHYIVLSDPVLKFYRDLPSTSEEERKEIEKILEERGKR